MSETREPKTEEPIPDGWARATLEETETLLLQKLDIQQREFLNRIRKYDGAGLRFQLGEKFELANDNGPILTADYELVGRYGYVENKEAESGLQVFWRWVWDIIDDERAEQLAVKLRAGPAQLATLAASVGFVSGDPMTISYVQSTLLEMMEYDYMFIVPVDKVFNAFGLSNVVWQLQEVGGDDE